MIAASNERALSYDNLSGMPEHLSDSFCCLATGASLGTRELYTDDEEIVLSAMRPCAFNGIDILSYRGDLLDRTLDAELSRIEEKDRKTEKEIDAAFEAVWPQILGLILDATVMGLKREDEIQAPNLPRMADFCKWVMACEPALPWKEGEFLEAYEKQAEDSKSTAVDGDPVARAILDLAMNYAQTGETFEGTATELLDELNSLRGINPTRPPKGWPKTGSILSSRITRAAPGLRSKKVYIERDRSGDERKITIGLMTVKCDGNDDAPKDAVIKKPVSSDPNDGQDGDDAQKHGYSVECERKEEEKSEKECERERIDGKKAVIVVTPSQSSQKIAISDMTAKEAMTTKAVIPEVCIICSSPIGPGHGTYFDKYCSWCGPKLRMIRVSAKALAGNGDRPTTDQIYEDLAMRGRPPLKEQLPAMLRAVGCIEEGNGWKHQEAKA